ncbi:phosphate ABC transporter ATP-binding protein PstB [Truepera radiovictrix]|uniref:Phosphate ABC transporter, ATPase subunit n=1 Tax=Truepera radiovictrix (strain DSM 17093 / CIP 108686 / LMG 22925 / RQ-24) TaxID=649638 RepID=D7CQN3_TRURR|nr:phosphate ABC transporter ATP-binding protein PstB [Truepera radiovictrix]ADI15017.1 phosphate ABC transporter, ATPase subunit [Truepera radiovictrix DSM 17093]WMT56430.1 phosphate ABC transporter ATP-binding protein PstB [Truepera radiovictrix]
MTVYVSPQTQTQEAPAARSDLLRIENLNIYFGHTHVVRFVTMQIQPNTVTALIGPSGCGKTTFLRSLNRMHDLTPSARIEGTVNYHGENIYGKGVDAVDVRRRIGMVFQKPNPFPTMSIYDNVVAGLKLAGERRKSRLDEVVERSLKQAALWDEVKDRLKTPATGLSGGQQQRLCIARSLAVEPEVLLMDEPTSALDPQSTQRIEDLMSSLKEYVTVIIVTHNMQQAARVSDKTAFFLLDESVTSKEGQTSLIEFDDTDKLFTNPSDPRTEAYITGRFG